MPTTSVRIATLNTWKGDGDYLSRLAMMRSGLAKLEIDILLLQEVLRVPGTTLNTARNLARSLGLQSLYAPSRGKRRETPVGECFSESGLAVLVRGNVLESDTQVLPSSDRGGERIALLVRALVKNEPWVIACTHFSHLRSEANLRVQQMETLFQHRWWRGLEGKAVIGGDFNAPLDHFPAALWGRNGWSAVSLAEGLSTHPLPPSQQGRQIDHLMIRVPRGLGLLQGNLALTEPNTKGVYPSDHALVWVDLPSEASL